MRVLSKKAVGLLLILTLALLGMACARSGEIISDALATERNLPTEIPQLNLSEFALYDIGDSVEIFEPTGRSVVALYDEIGARFFASQIIPGEIAEVIEHGIDDDENIWYLVSGTTGTTGWITDEFLKIPGSE
jgi:hypothetical protein